MPEGYEWIYQKSPGCYFLVAPVGRRQNSTGYMVFIYPNKVEKGIDPPAAGWYVGGSKVWSFLTDIPDLPLEELKQWAVTVSVLEGLKL